jgi:hypothetical protein
MLQPPVKGGTKDDLVNRADLVCPCHPVCVYVTGRLLSMCVRWSLGPWGVMRLTRSWQQPGWTS